MVNSIDFITEFIFVENDIEPCDVALVPGGSHSQLAEKAAEIHKQGFAKNILFSGSKNPKIAEYLSEAEYLKSIAVSLGVPDDCIMCESKATHTFENAEFSYLLLKEMNFRMNKIILICKAYHSRRALLTYQHIFPQNTEFIVLPITDKNGLNKNNWYIKNEYVEQVMNEVEKIGKYFKDKISVFDCN